MRKFCILFALALIACFGLASVVKAATQTIEGETFVRGGTHSIDSNAAYSGGQALKINDGTYCSTARTS